jgi:hypothetical protein
MEETAKGRSVDEQKLVKMYMELTGTSESCSRSVFMHVCSAGPEATETPEINRALVQ